jgi:hypothetical protein
MDFTKLPEGILTAFALVGAIHLLDLLWKAITTFYFQRAQMRLQMHESPAKLRLEQEMNRKYDVGELMRQRHQVFFDYSNAMIQLLKSEGGWTPEVAKNAVDEVFKLADEAAKKKHPDPEDYPPIGIV